MNAAKAKEVLERYRKGDCTADEVRLVEQWYLQLEETADFEWAEGEKEYYARMMHDNLMQKIREKGKVRSMNVRRWVAAAVILLVVGSLWFVVERGRRAQDAGSKVEVAKTNDVEAPKDTRAVITLADGSKVYLDSAGSGTIAKENGANVLRNENGAISYELNREDAKTQGTLVYNTLTNPRGSKVIDMQLSDGSHVWLNAGSSVKYPVAFVSNERRVEITGEAYFEVAHIESPALKGTPFNKGGRAKAQPFIVKHGDVEVTVLGTHFNVNAYDDEESLKVTLLEGSVRVAGHKSQVTITPGQQAVVANDIQVKKGVDVDEVMAWKNGKFSFNKVDIKIVMRQLARWYDLEVVYQGKVTEDKFWGDIQRDLPLSKTLDFLKKSQVHFKVEGKTVTVMP